MKAGRELDALVAEKVLGWRITPDQYPVDNTGQSRITIPRYSTDIGAAWTVVEHTSLFATCSISEFQDEGAPGWCIESMSDGWEVYADTAPLAICLAALRAVGVEVD